MSTVNTDHVIGTQVVRTCPRCHKRLYHTVWSEDLWRGLKQKIKCASCGHVWIGRLTHDETEGYFAFPAGRKDA